MKRERRAEDRRKLFERVNDLVARGRTAKGIALLENALASHLPDDRVLLRLAALLRQEGEDARAADAFVQASRIYAQQGFTLRVIAALRQAVALTPHDLSLLHALADANLEVGLPRDAAGWLEATAKAYAERNEPEQALAARRRILELQPGDLGSSIRLADLLVQLDRAAEALQLLRQVAAPIRPGSEPWLLVNERIVDLDPGDDRLALAVAGELLSRGSPKGALARLRPALERHLDDPAALLLVARTFAAMGLTAKAAAAWRELAHLRRGAGDVPGAREAWRRVRELLPGDAEAAVALAPRAPTVQAELDEAAFFAEQGLVAEARAILARLAETNPLDPIVGARLDEFGPPPESRPRLDADELVVDLEVEAVSIEDERPRDGTTTVLTRIGAATPDDPANAQAHADLAIAFVEMELFDDASAEAERALAADPGHAAQWCALLGRCHLEGGRPNHAIDAYRRALLAKGLSVTAAVAVRYELGVALAQTGDRGAALAQLREVARLEPGFRDVERRITSLERAAGRGPRHPAS